jgi:hypothetical protein
MLIKIVKKAEEAVGKEINKFVKEDENPLNQQEMIALQIKIESWSNIKSL